jgi:hypothetical protein
LKERLNSNYKKVMMKKILFVFILFSSVKFANAQAYLYHPFADSNAVWSNYYSDTNGSGYYQFSIIGDTIINALSYHKLYYYNENNNNPTDTLCLVNHSILGGAIREDSLNRVYFYNMNLTGMGKEKDSIYLLYDFSKNVGDTIFFTNQMPSYPYSEPYFVISSIDSVLVNNQYRKKYNFLSSPESWIEGIGSTRYLTSTISPYPTCSCFDELICYKFNDITYYLNPTYHTCFPFDGVGVQNLMEDESVSISPNPSNGKVLIAIKTSNYQKLSIEIYNTLGEKVYSLQNNTLHEKTEIDISSEPNGIYFYQIKSNVNIIGSGKMLVITH